jgi:gluconate 2-dehydrogenase
LLGEVDFVCVVVPLTERRHKLIGRRELALMKPSAVLVNEQEPLRESPLFALSNVVTLPHAGSATHETRRAMVELALDNLEQALLGGTPRYRVNPRVRGT